MYWTFEPALRKLVAMARHMFPRPMKPMVSFSGPFSSHLSTFNCNRVRILPSPMCSRSSS